MKQIFFLFTCIFSVIVYNGCTSIESEELSESFEVPNIVISSDGSYSMDEILSRASQYYAMLPGKTRAVTPGVRDIERISKLQTRSDNDSLVYPLYYIVNYENEKGFVIVGGNSDSDDMVAVSDEGNLNLSDTVNNPGLTAFINEINGSRPPVSPTLPPIGYDTIKPGIECLSVNPLISENVRKWGQGAPFNSATPISNGVRSKTGSAALSFAMLMTYHEWPPFIIKPLINIDWESIKNHSYTPQLGTILYTLGQNIYTRYGKDYSGTDIQKNCAAIEHILADNWTYTFIPADEPQLKNFNFSCVDSIKSQLPAIMWGNNPDHTKQQYPDTWVIDGVLHVTSAMVMEPLSKDEFYFHCIWGNYGSGNGYFKYEHVKKIGGKRYNKTGTDGVYDGYSDTDQVPIYEEELSPYLILIPIPIISVP